MKIRIGIAAVLAAAGVFGSLPAHAHGQVQWSVTIGSQAYVQPGVVMVPQTQYSYGAPPSVYTPPPPILPPPQPYYVQPPTVYVMPPPIYQYAPPARLNVDPWNHSQRFGSRHDGRHDGRFERDWRSDRDGGRDHRWDRR